jgi:transposase
VGVVGAVKFEARIKELVENVPDLAIVVEPLLIVRQTLRQQIVFFIFVCWPLSAMMRCAGA